MRPSSTACQPRRRRQEARAISGHYRADPDRAGPARAAAALVSRAGCLACLAAPAWLAGPRSARMVALSFLDRRKAGNRQEVAHGTSALAVASDHLVGGVRLPGE